jgi:hypothetical protein
MAISVTFEWSDANRVAFELFTPDKSRRTRRRLALHREFPIAPVLVAFAWQHTDGVAFKPFAPDKAGGARGRCRRRVLYDPDEGGCEWENEGQLGESYSFHRYTSDNISCLFLISARWHR